MSEHDEDDDASQLLDAAYSVETPEDSRRLYARWAETYDTDFVAASGYVYPENVASLLLDSGGGVGGAIADIGCGTGVVGVALGDMGEKIIDGIDISPEMLAVAAAKETVFGDKAYRNMIEADLTDRIDVPDDTYSAVISTGTFTHGHLGPEALDEVLRIALPTALCAIGVNEHFYAEMGFDRWFGAAAQAGRITAPSIVSVAIFEALEGDHAGTRGNVALFQVLG